MKGRYQLRHPIYGRGYKYERLDLAERELAKCVPANEWYVYDRLEKRVVTVSSDLEHPDRNERTP